MEILSNEEVNDVVTWLPHGKAFIIYKKKKFAAEVLPKFFKQSKFTSFTRKLNRWGFTRVTRGPETGSYFHKFFLRDQPRLCMQMSCQNARLQSEQQFAMGQPHPQSMMGGIPGGMPGGMQGMQGGMPGMPGGMQDMQFGAGMMSNPALLQMQRQFQLEQQLQQQQQLQAELLRRAMASQASSGSTQAQLMSGGGVNKKEDMLYMQMLAQSKASSMSAQPLMRAIQNSLMTNQSPMQPPSPEPERAVRRASAA